MHGRYHGRGGFWYDRHSMRRILIVEDDALLGSVLHTAFRREWTVELAESADEALRLFRASPPEIVLTDKNLPGMDGISLLRELRQLDATVGIVVMTAYGTVESARDSLDWNVDAYVEKPFPDLFELVRELGELRERVVARRERVQAEQGVPLELVVACKDPRRRAALRELIGEVERLGWCDSVEELAAAVERGDCTVAVLDCPSFHGSADAEQAAAAIDRQKAACVVIAEGLSVFQITRLIDLRIRALVDRRIDDLRFGEMLRRGLERIRSGHH
jgi:CheY-like chemotaxis protein